MAGEAREEIGCLILPSRTNGTKRDTSPGGGRDHPPCLLTARGPSHLLKPRSKMIVKVADSMVYTRRLSLAAVRGNQGCSFEGNIISSTNKTVRT